MDSRTRGKEIRPTLLLLFAAAGLLFLITCANAAGLLLACSVAQARETAIRVALGARRRQLAAYYFAEGLPVSLAGAAGGMLMSVVLTPAIVSMAADYLPRAEEIAVDWTVLETGRGAADHTKRIHDTCIITGLGAASCRFKGAK